MTYLHVIIASEYQLYRRYRFVDEQLNLQMTYLMEIGLKIFVDIGVSMCD